MKKDLKKVKSDESREKIMKAIKILKQRQATEKDIEIKRRVKLNLQKEQMEKLKNGQRASFLTRSKSFLTLNLVTILFEFKLIISPKI